MRQRAQSGTLVWVATDHRGRVRQHLPQAFQEAVILNDLDLVLIELGHVEGGRLAHVRVLVLISAQQF